MMSSILNASRCFVVQMGELNKKIAPLSAIDAFNIHPYAIFVKGMNATCPGGAARLPEV